MEHVHKEKQDVRVVITDDGDRWEFYTAADGDHWWRHLAAGNNELVGGSTEGYKNRGDALENAKRNGFREPAA